MSDRLNGTVKWFNPTKGFGFIAGDDAKDYFVHHSALPKDMVLQENDKVSFKAVVTDRGEQAQEVQFEETKDESSTKEEGKDSAEF